MNWKRVSAVVATFSVAVAAVVGQSSGVSIPADKALLVIRVPAEDAVVKIREFTSTQRGIERMYFTPELTPGTMYEYPVEVEWTEAGKRRKTVRMVQFQAGHMTTIQVTAADAAAPLPPVNVAKPQPAQKTSVKDRHFQFTYAGAIKDVKPGTEVSVWLPVAVSGPEQEVKIISQMPKNAKTYKEKQYGNVSLYFKAKANDKGQVPFEIVYDVVRREVKTDLSANLTLKPTPGENLKRFLEPDAKVPVTGKPLELLKDKKLPPDQFATAKVLYDTVNTHMKYSKDGIGWGQGDSVWACDSKFGNCSDFHSLFISMARGNQIPSKFEMGFPIPPKRGDGVVGGYHCWAWFLPNQKGWIPVDISEANRNPELKDYYFGNLTEDRVRFTTGRDINLEPRQSGPALNFFIYPYAEVGGQAHPQEKVERRFAYKDVN